MRPSSADPYEPLRLALLAASIALGAPAIVSAQAAPETADALLDRGADLRAEGRDLDALEVFQRAYDVERSARALAQIGLAEQAIGSWVIAEQHVEQALAQSSDPWIATHRAALERALTTIRQRLATVELIGGALGAEVWINGALAGTLPLDPQRVVAGTVHLEVRSESHHPWRRTIELAGGATAREQVSLARRDPESAPAATIAARESDTALESETTSTMIGPTPPLGADVTASADEMVVPLLVATGVAAAAGLGTLAAALALDAELSGAPPGAAWADYEGRAAAITPLEIAGVSLLGAAVVLGGAALIVALTHRGSASVAWGTARFAF